MNGKIAPHMVHTSFYAIYRQYYAPQFMEIDIMLKAMEAPLGVAETARMLQITEAAVRDILADESVKELDKPGFLTVMSLGESAVCALYRRELTRGRKPAYSPSDIAYIYGLQEDHVRGIFEKLSLRDIPARDVPWLLDQIPMFLLY